MATPLLELFPYFSHFHPCNGSHPPTCPGCTLASPKWGCPTDAGHEPASAKTYQVRLLKSTNPDELVRFRVQHNRPDGQMLAVYFVSRCRRKAPTCSCLAYGYCKGHSKTCKHIRYLKPWIDHQLAKMQPAF